MKNIKKSYNYNNLMIPFIGLIFIITSITRLTIEEQRKKELIYFNLPDNFDYFIIIFELVVGCNLLFNSQYNDITLKILFILFAILLILINNFDKLWEDRINVFTFQPTITSFMLHVTYLFIVLGLIM